MSAQGLIVHETSLGLLAQNARGARRPGSLGSRCRMDESAWRQFDPSESRGQNLQLSCENFWRGNRLSPRREGATDFAGREMLPIRASDLAKLGEVWSRATGKFVGAGRGKPPV